MRLLPAFAPWSLVALALAFGGCSRPPAGAGISIAPLVRFAIPGASNNSVSIAARGRHVVLVWAATAGERTDAYAAVSIDAGATFAPPTRLNDLEGDVRASGEQPPRVAIGEDVVVVWQSRLTGQSRVRLSRSNDGGRSFEPAVTVHASSLTGARGWASLAIDRTGVTHVAWLDGRNASGGRPAGASVPPHAHGSRAPMRQDLFQAALFHDGTTVESSPAQDVCFCCKTAIASGADGATYVAWRHIYPTSLRDIAVARSIDGGRTFAPPVRVSEDGWQFEGCPEDGPSIAIDDQRRLHVTWPTVVMGTADEKGIFYTYSADGGRTFGPRIRLDDPQRARTVAHPQSTLSGAETLVAWDESVEGARRVRLRRIVTPPSGGLPELHAPVTLGEDGTSSSYPAVAATAEGVLVAWTSTTSTGSQIHLQRLP